MSTFEVGNTVTHRAMKVKATIVGLSNWVDSPFPDPGLEFVLRGDFGNDGHSCHGMTDIIQWQAGERDAARHLGHNLHHSYWYATAEELEHWAAPTLEDVIASHPPLGSYVRNIGGNPHRIFLLAGYQYPEPNAVEERHLRNVQAILFGTEFDYRGGSEGHGGTGGARNVTWVRGHCPSQRSSRFSYSGYWFVDSMQLTVVEEPTEEELQSMVF